MPVFFNIINEVGGICGAIITITAALTVLCKPIRKAVLRMFGKDKAALAMLRNDITCIYHKYLDAKAFPPFAQENLISLYDAYKDEGGNSYVDKIYKEMMKWEVER